jgi:hypothetical protein
MFVARHPRVMASIAPLSMADQQGRPARVVEDEQVEANVGVDDEFLWNRYHVGNSILF